MLNKSYSDKNCIGDHVCCFSDLRKLSAAFPEWPIARSLPILIEEMLQVEEARRLKEPQ